MQSGWMMLWKTTFRRRPNFKKLLCLTMDYSLVSSRCLSLSTTSHRHDFLQSTLKRTGVFDSHLFYRPLEIDNRELEYLQTSFQEAASRKDVTKLLKLSEEVPLRQAEDFRSRLNSSTLVLFHLILADYFREAIEGLQTKVDNDSVLSVVTAAFYFSWFSSKSLSSDHVTLTETLDKVMVSSQNQVHLSTWCRFIQWRLSVKLPSYQPHNRFLRNIAPSSQTTKDILAVSFLLGGISKRVNMHNGKKIEKQFAQIMLQNPKIWYDDEELMGAVCFGLYRVNDGQRITDRRLKTLLWDIIVHKMKHDNSKVLSPPLDYCLKLAGVSMHKAALKDFPYLLEKSFSSIKAVHSKLTRVSPSASVELFSNIVSSRHIDVAVANRLLQQSVNTQWNVQPLQMVEKTICAIANYGCTDKNILSPIIKTILSPERDNEFMAQPHRFLALLTNLAYMQIFPHRLLAMFFGTIMTKAFTLPSPANCWHITWLNGALPILCPGYGGPRLSEDILRDMHRRIQDKSHEAKDLRKYPDGTPTLFHQMTQLQSTLESLPPVVGRYIVQTKPSLAHFREDDIMLITTDPSVSNVVILLNTEDYLLRLYNESWEVSYQLCAERKSKMAQLRKLGYITVAINFDEYLAATNHSQLIMDKLKAAKVI